MNKLMVGVLWLCLVVPHGAAAKPSCGKGGQLGEGTGSVSGSGGSYLIKVPSAYDPKKEIPLVFALHGDEGTPDYIYSVFKKMQDLSGGAFILVSPKAPSGGGSWYQAQQTHTTFIDQLTDKMKKEYNIDQDRMYILGWSGGSYFLADYAILRQDVWAAVVYQMGTSRGDYSPPPGSCKIPARFVTGGLDFSHLNSAKKHHDMLQTQSHEVVWIVMKGVGHKLDQATLQPTWDWLSKRTLCNTTTPGSCDGSKPPPPQPPAPPPGNNGPAPPTDQPAPFGATCSAGDECQSGMCATIPSQRSYCTQTCDPAADSCPGGATCEATTQSSHACGPPRTQVQPDNEAIGGDLLGGCQMAAGDDPGAPLTLLLMLALLNLQRRRR